MEPVPLRHDRNSSPLSFLPSDLSQSWSRGWALCAVSFLSILGEEHRAKASRGAGAGLAASPKGLLEVTVLWEGDSSSLGESCNSNGFRLPLTCQHPRREENGPHLSAASALQGLSYFQKGGRSRRFTGRTLWALSVTSSCLGMYLLGVLIKFWSTC